MIYIVFQAESCHCLFCFRPESYTVYCQFWRIFPELPNLSGKMLQQFLFVLCFVLLVLCKHGLFYSGFSVLHLPALISGTYQSRYLSDPTLHLPTQFSVIYSPPDFVTGPVRHHHYEGFLRSQFRVNLLCNVTLPGFEYSLICFAYFLKDKLEYFVLSMYVILLKMKINLN